MTGGYAELNAPPINIVTPVTPSGFKSAELFEQLSDVVNKVGEELAQKVKAVFLWRITKDGATSSWSELLVYTDSTWQYMMYIVFLPHVWFVAVDLKNAPGSVYSGEPKDGAKPGCTITLSDDDFVALVNGKLNPQEVHMHACVDGLE